MSILYELLARKPILRQTCPEIVGAAADMEQLKAENAKLRATLEDVCGAPTLRKAQSIAYTALNEKTKLKDADRV